VVTRVQFLLTGKPPVLLASAASPVPLAISTVTAPASTRRPIPRTVARVATHAQPGKSARAGPVYVLLALPCAAEPVWTPVAIPTTAEDAVRLVSLDKRAQVGYVRGVQAGKPAAMERVSIHRVIPTTAARVATHARLERRARVEHAAV